MKKKEKESVVNLKMNKNRYLELLLYIVILGAALRFYNLGFNSFWLDEAATYVNINTGSITTVLSNVVNDHHAPFYFVVVWFVHFLSSSEFWLRMPSAIAGIATIIVVYFLGKELVNEKVGLFSALLLAVSSYHIYYSQEARMYTFTTLFVTLAIYLFFKTRESEEYWLLVWLCCVLAFYTHFYTGFIIIPLVIGFLFTRDKFDIMYFVAGGVMAFFMVLPIVSSFLSQATYLGSKTYGWGLPAILIPFATLQSFSFQNQFVAVVFLLLSVLGVWLLWSKDKQMAIIVTVFLLVPLLISMVMSTKIPFNVRYHIYLLPLFLVVVSIGIERVTRIWNNRNATIAAMFLILVCAMVTLTPYYSEYSKEDWRGFSQELTKDTKIGDVVVLVPSYMSLPFTHYYSNSTDATILEYANSMNDLQNINPDRKIFYVVTGDINAQDPSGGAWNWISKNTKPVGQYTGIYLFVKERPL